MTDINATISALWRMESAKIIGGLTRIVRDIGLAEELAQDALVAALEQWPHEGIPANPGAWLMTTAKRRAIDRFRRNRMMRDKNAELAQELDAREDVSVQLLEATLDDDIGDERLALIFAACHPDLAAEARAALTLRLLGGLSIAEIARAFLSSEAAIAQRITRAKRTLKEGSYSFEVPHGAARDARLQTVLQVIYLIFNEGYAASSGEDFLRTRLCEEAMRLNRILAELAPGEPEVLGLMGLMEIQASRFGARRDPNGQPVLLLEQDRQLWDRLLIRRGLSALTRAEKLTQHPGPYQLQAAIAACHARARTAEETDWKQIAALYAALLGVMPSPVVALNQAVAIGMAFGPELGLQHADALLAVPELQAYHLLPAVRADLLHKLGRLPEAAGEYERAAGLATNPVDQKALRDRAASCRL